MNRRIKYLLHRNYVIAFLKLIRLRNLLIIVLMQYFTRIFIIGPKFEWKTLLFEPEIFFLTLATVLVAAAGYIVNDYYDIKIDMINKPKRVILGRIISRRMGLVLQWTLALLALIICLVKLSFNVALFVGFCSFLLWFYSNQLKRMVLWGNVTIAFLGFASFFMLSLYYQRREELVMFFGIFAFLTTLIREIIKDMEDVPGDQNFGCKTIPIVYGIPRTKLLLRFIISLTLILISVSYVYINKYLYLYFLLFTSLPMIYILFSIIRSDKKEDFAALSKNMKLVMILGIFGMLLS
mgnify:CR=1 FL=1